MDNIIIKQVDYIRSAQKETTARNIIRTKLENCRYLLTRFRNTRKNSLIGKSIFLHQNMLHKHASSLEKTPYTRLMLTEAQAGKHYWESFKIICKQDNEWSRVYPHAKDSLNSALNIGYTSLGRLCRDALLKSGLHLSLGIIHSPNHAHGLAYDFMEMWRQVVVDAIVIPLFSRGATSVSSATLVFKIQERLKTEYRYNGETVELGRIIEYEAYELRKAIERRETWRPFRTQWGNSRTIKKPALTGSARKKFPTE